MSKKYNMLFFSNEIHEKNCKTLANIWSVRGIKNPQDVLL